MQSIDGQCPNGEMMVEKDYNLNVQWGQFHQHVLDSRREMYNTKQFTDVALISKDNKKIQAHKSILGPASVLLNKVFIGQDPKNPATKIFLNDIMADELSALLEFIYLGETVIQEERLSEFRAATKVLHIVGVEEQKADKLPIFIDNQNQSPKLENNTESIDKSVHVKKEFEFVSANIEKDDGEIDGSPVNTTTRIEEKLNIMDRNDSEHPTGYIDVGNLEREESKKLTKYIIKKEQVASHKNHPKILPHKESGKKQNQRNYDNIYDIFDSDPVGSGDRFYKGVNVEVETKCPDCEAQLKAPSVLRSHIIFQHSGLKYDCHLCNYRTTRKFSLKFHIQTIHFGIKFRCSFCAYKVSKKPRLIEHMRNIHNFEAPDEFEPEVSQDNFLDRDIKTFDLNT